MKILHKIAGAVLFEAEVGSIKLCVDAAVSQGVDLWGANLWCANLSGADLRGANLWGANLRSANLSGADLWGADLWCADLRESDLWGINFGNGDLLGANLMSAENIIHVGPTIDRREFFGVIHKDVLMIKAGRRWFNLEEGKKHWSGDGDRDPKINEERRDILEFMEKWYARNS